VARYAQCGRAARGGRAAAVAGGGLAGLRDISGPVIAVADALEWLAAAVAAAGRAARAARLYGAAARLRRDAGGARYAPDRPAYERDVAETRAQLSRPAFAAAWAAGDAMTLEETVAYALEAPPAVGPAQPEGAGGGGAGVGVGASVGVGGGGTRPGSPTGRALSRRRRGGDR
jgi:hypothetical protein